MMLLVRNAETFAPEPLGRRDILCAGGTIVALEPRIDSSGLPGDPEIIDAAGAVVVPGLVDGHVHVSGGGGEAGFGSRTPPLDPADAFRAGVTTVIGTLGTDGITRSMEDLVARTFALRESGLSAWCLTGSYRVPPRTLTGDVMKDIMFIEPILGLGEIALSDHRSSRPTDAEVARLFSEARIGGMLSGKTGIVCVHLGDAPDGFGSLERAIASGELPRSQIWPTHCGRNPGLLEAAFSWIGSGGYADFTASPPDLSGLERPDPETSGLPNNPSALTSIDSDRGQTSASASFAKGLSKGLSPESFTWTSDGQGSLPRFDANGRISGYEVGTCSSLLAALRSAVLRLGIPLKTALLPVTMNPAKILGLDRKGRIAAGADADLVVMGTDLVPRLVIAKGRLVMSVPRD
ncbi:MAG: beta-aspartyl-peptidase [Spirochaetia bacterium]|nr:beta-aspartyl-peptidase [Spirochaetia bacterium]